MHITQDERAYKIFVMKYNQGHDCCREGGSDSAGQYIGVNGPIFSACKRDCKVLLALINWKACFLNAQELKSQMASTLRR